MAYTWFILLLTLMATAVMLVLLHGTSLGHTLHEPIPDRPRRRLFVASMRRYQFLVTSFRTHVR